MASTTEFGMLREGNGMDIQMYARCGWTNHSRIHIPAYPRLARSIQNRIMIGLQKVQDGSEGAVSNTGKVNRGRQIGQH
jgi:hypothetical protein